jgi:hypothetical protein
MLRRPVAAAGCGEPPAVARSWASQLPQTDPKGEVMKKTTIKKITLSKETLLSLQENGLRVGGGNTGPSCEIFRLCTIAGWDC